METVTPAQIEGVVSMLQGVLGADNTQRKQQEAELVRLRAQHPNELVLCLLSSLRSQPNTSVRALSAVLLRQFCSQDASRGVWKVLREDVKKAVKTEVLEAAKGEEDKGVRRRVGDVVGVVGATVVTSDGGWQELFPFLFQLAASSDAGVSTSLRAFSCLFPYVYECFLPHKTQLLQLFSLALAAQDLEVKMNALEALAALLVAADFSEMQECTQLTQSALLAAFSLVSHAEQDGKLALEHLLKIAESEAKFYYHCFPLVLEFQQRVAALRLDSSVNSLALELVTCIVECRPRLVARNQSICQELMEQVFALMVSGSSEVDESWLSPSADCVDADEEQNAENSDIDYTKTERKVVLRLLESVGDAVLLPFVLTAVQKLISDGSDWRKKYAALMTISQIGKFVSEAEKIAGILPILVAECDGSKHPKIRFAVFYCVEKLCVDLEDEIKEPHHMQLSAMLDKGLSDAVPRVVAQAIRATGQFFSNCSNQISTTYFSGFLPRLSAFLNSGTPSLLIENALTALSQLSESSTLQFTPYFPQLHPYLTSMIRRYTAPQHRRLRGKAIDCLARVCCAVDTATLRPLLAGVVTLLKEVQESEREAPVVEFLLGAWQRLCEKLKTEFEECLPLVVPGLLEMAETTASASCACAPTCALDLESLLRDSRTAQISVSTSDTESKVLALETLLTIADSMRAAYFPYVERTIRIVLPLANYSVNEGVRGAAASLLAALLKSVKASNQPDATQKSAIMGKVFLNIIHPALMEEFELDAMLAQLVAIKDIVEVPGIVHLAADEVLHLGREMMKLLEKSLFRRQQIEKDRKCGIIDTEDEDDKEFEEIIEEEEDRVHTALSEVFGALFKTHSEASVPIVRFLCENVLRPFLDPSSRCTDHKFSLFLIDDIIEFIGPSLVPDLWGTLVEALLRYATSPDDSVRQAACYGIGILATRTEQSAFGQYSTSVLDALVAAISIPARKSAKAHGHARDNAIAALGKIIKCQQVDRAQWVPYWIKLLPIRCDKVEARLMHEELASLVQQHSALFLMPDGQFFPLLPHIIWTFGEILDTKLVPASILPTLQQFFTSLQSSNLNGLAALWSSLPPLHKRRISALLESR